MSSSTLDPYTAKAENNTLTPQEKIAGLHEILKHTKAGMLTTHGADGHLHSRAMSPSSRTYSRTTVRDDTKSCAAFDDTQLTLVFLANNSTAKFEEIKNDSHVNVSFCDTNSTSWASYVVCWIFYSLPHPTHRYSGTAKVSQNKELIRKHFSSASVQFLIHQPHADKAPEEWPHTLVT
jgi:general stress protein 26